MPNKTENEDYNEAIMNGFGSGVAATILGGFIVGIMNGLSLAEYFNNIGVTDEKSLTWLALLNLAYVAWPSYIANTDEYKEEYKGIASLSAAGTTTAAIALITAWSYVAHAPDSQQSEYIFDQEPLVLSMEDPS